MALPGYPKTFDHPQMTIIEASEEVTGQIVYLKAAGGDPSDWIEYEVKYPQSNNPTLLRTIRITVGSSLHGPFSYVKHNVEGETGAGASGRDCYTQIFETEV